MRQWFTVKLSGKVTSNDEKVNFSNFFLFFLLHFITLLILHVHLNKIYSLKICRRSYLKVQPRATRLIADPTVTCVCESSRGAKTQIQETSAEPINDIRCRHFRAPHGFTEQSAWIFILLYPASLSKCHNVMEAGFLSFLSNKTIKITAIRSYRNQQRMEIFIKNFVMNNFFQ